MASWLQKMSEIDPTFIQLMVCHLILSTIKRHKYRSKFWKLHAIAFLFIILYVLFGKIFTRRSGYWAPIVKNVVLSFWNRKLLPLFVSAIGSHWFKERPSDRRHRALTLTMFGLLPNRSFMSISECILNDIISANSKVLFLKRRLYFFQSPTNYPIE